MSAPAATHPVQHAFKRALEVIVAAVALLFAAPVIAICALLIRSSSPGPILFRQSRAGRFGRPFIMLKLRTMYLDADDLLKLRLAMSPELEQEWRRYRRLRRDPRVAGRVGVFLRRWSLDELPQLWNVLSGEMSLVGPRPLELPVLAQYPIDTRAHREQVRPGISGLWQVSGRSETDLDALMALDDRYVAEWSLWNDLVILCRTPGAVFSGRGAY